MFSTLATIAILAIFWCVYLVGVTRGRFLEAQQIAKRLELMRRGQERDYHDFLELQ